MKRVSLEWATKTGPGAVTCVHPTPNGLLRTDKVTAFLILSFIIIIFFVKRQPTEHFFFLMNGKIIFFKNLAFAGIVQMS